MQQLENLKSRKFLSSIFYLSLLVTFNLEAMAQSHWWNNQWSYRLQMAVDCQGIERQDKPVEVALNFTDLLSDAGPVAAFNSNSIRVIEVDRSGRVLDEKVPSQFDRDENYNSITHATGKLIFLLKGKTSATRYYHIYFDSSSNIQPAITTSHLSLMDHYAYEGQESYKIVSDNATYYYHKQGAGFAAILDEEEHDWIGYHLYGKAGGEERGLPNLGEFAHPGLQNSHSRIINQGPLKITIYSETNDGKSALTWEIFPSYARMTLLRTNKPYWFMYQGTPAGKLNLQTAYMVSSDERKIYARQDWQWDLPSPEWIYFGDENYRRTLFLVNHDDDDKPDQYWTQDGQTTVFGFGRKYKCCDRYLTKTPAQFTFGLAESTNYFSVRKQIANAYQQISIKVGDLEGRETPFALADKKGPQSQLMNEETGELLRPYQSKREHKFFGGYCTWYAAKKFKEFTGFPVTWSGNGGMWFDNAAAEGRKVSVNLKEAVKGAVIVWTRNPYGKGHVAFVESVDETGVYISEMNVRGRWIVSDAFIPYANPDKGTKYKFKGIILPE